LSPTRIKFSSPCHARGLNIANNAKGFFKGKFSHMIMMKSTLFSLIILMQPRSKKRLHYLCAICSLAWRHAYNPRQASEPTSSSEESPKSESSYVGSSDDDSPSDEDGPPGKHISKKARRGNMNADRNYQYKPLLDIDKSMSSETEG
jgi:hypothetical protein